MSEKRVYSREETIDYFWKSFRRSLICAAGLGMTHLFPPSLLGTVIAWVWGGFLAFYVFSLFIFNYNLKHDLV